MKKKENKINKINKKKKEEASKYSQYRCGLTGTGVNGFIYLLGSEYNSSIET